MLSAKQKSEPSAREVLAALDARVAKLQKAKATKINRILELEAKGVKPEAPSGRTLDRPVTQADALAMLDRGEVIEPGEVRGNELWEIMREIKLIDAAITEGGSRGLRHRLANESELMGDVAARWRQNIAETVKLISKMRELADERKRLREEYSSRTGLMFSMPAGLQADAIVGPSGVRCANVDAFLDVLPMATR